MRWRGPSWKLWAAPALLLLAGTNVWVTMLSTLAAQDLHHAGARPFLAKGEKVALDWLRQNVSQKAVVQPLPWIVVADNGRVKVSDTTVACFTPGLTGNALNAGHWSETPNYQKAMDNWRRFLLPHTPDEWRRDLLHRTGVRYLIFSQKRAETRDDRTAQLLAGSEVLQGQDYVRRIAEASNEDVDVFEVVKP